LLFSIKNSYIAQVIFLKKIYLYNIKKKNRYFCILNE